MATKQLAPDQAANQVQAQPETQPDARRVVAIIPAYDEDRFIASVVLKARRFVDEVIVVDDGSKDETAWIAESAGARVIRQPSNQGKAAALNVGLAEARAMDARAAILIDGDGQQNPNDIPAMLRPILEGDADVVVGSRFIGLRSRAPRWRIFGQRALTLATNLASGVALTDSQSGFRALSRRALDTLNFRTTGFSVESEMQFLIKKHNLVAREVPIIVTYDERPKRSPIRQGVQVLNGILRMIAQHRPLVFFGIPGALITLAGMAIGLRVVQQYFENIDNPQFALGTFLVAITMCIIGVFTAFTGLILYAIRSYMTER